MYVSASGLIIKSTADVEYIWNISGKNINWMSLFRKLITWLRRSVKEPC